MTRAFICFLPACRLRFLGGGISNGELELPGTTADAIGEDVVAAASPFALLESSAVNLNLLMCFRLFFAGAVAAAAGRDGTYGGISMS